MPRLYSLCCAVSVCAWMRSHKMAEDTQKWVCAFRGGSTIWRKKTSQPGSIDAVLMKHVLSDVHAIYFALHSGLHVNQFGLFKHRRARLAVCWLRGSRWWSSPHSCSKCQAEVLSPLPERAQESAFKTLLWVLALIYFHKDTYAFFNGWICSGSGILYLTNVQNLHFWIKQHYIWRKKRTLTFPGSSLERGTLRKHLFNERLCRIEFCRRKGRQKSV